MIACQVLADFTASVSDAPPRGMKNKSPAHAGLSVYLILYAWVPNRQGYS